MVLHKSISRTQSVLRVVWRREDTRGVAECGLNVRSRDSTRVSTRPDTCDILRYHKVHKATTIRVIINLVVIAISRCVEVHKCRLMYIRKCIVATSQSVKASTTLYRISLENELFFFSFFFCEIETIDVYIYTFLFYDELSSRYGNLSDEKYKNASDSKI